MTLNVSKVTKCACGNCTEKTTILQGIVVGGPDEKPIKFGDVIYAGKLVATADREGRFSITIPGNVKRAIVTFKDFVFEEFEETDKVFVLTEGQLAFYKVKLRKPAPPIVFNASKPIEIPLESDSGAGSFAELDLPEEALLTEDGSVFHGNAKAKVTVFDPRNLTDVLSAPGDFTTVDEEGEEELLQTFGMMRLRFEDEVGKKLAMSKVMKVYLDPEKLNMTIQGGSNVTAKLYWLDKKTGRWREAGDFLPEDGSKRRRKRTNRIFLVADVTPAIQLEILNFDYPEERVAVRVTTPQSDSIVRVIRQDGKAYNERTTTGSDPSVACIPIWRNTGCHLQAEYDGKFLEAKSKGVGDFPPYINVSIQSNALMSWFYFKSELKENSILKTPLYKHSDSEVPPEECMSSSQLEGVNQFTFLEKQNASSDYSLSYKNPAWQWGNDTHLCFIKVKITGVSAVFLAESYAQNDYSEAGQYGYQLRSSIEVSDGKGRMHIVCLAYRCSAEKNHTYVMVAPLTRKNCTFQKKSNAFKSLHCTSKPPESQGQEKWFCIPKLSTNHIIPISFEGFMKRKNQAKAKCQQGNQQFIGTTPDKITELGWALTYHCQ